MMKFLMNDFDEPRWRSAAIKNAYALLSKHRFGKRLTRLILDTDKVADCHAFQSTEYAAAFFLLGDSLKDCLGVCLRQLDDWVLAIAIARVYDGDEGSGLRDLLHNHIVPMAFAKGFRRLASWAFWMLKRRDLAIRVIVVSSAISCAFYHQSH
jgi:hypothetical protein